MRLKVERFADLGVGGEERLGGSLRFEPLLLSLLVQMPAGRRPIAAPMQIGREQGPDLITRHRTVSRLTSIPLGPQLLDIADAQREPELPTHRLNDHRRGNGGA